ncbi:Hypothetical predicted protein [Paramuricea clavata]|uniref:Uncharacterized protein n=1 Tax=Paramuricea clavata TaxID=317549 RepID=A0A7D9E0E0_PARCT|nr:Hypothetical predicted protein [Paramuricea clavata]
MCVLRTHSAGASNGPLPLYRKLENKLEGRNGERAIVPSVNESEVQHDIVMYWTEIFQGDVDINLVLKGSNSRTERIRLQQNTRKPGFWNTARAKAMVYRVMIKPVPGLNSVAVSSSGTLPNFKKVLVVNNDNVVYEFPFNQPSKRTLLNRPMNQAVEAALARGNGLCVNPVNSDLPPPLVTRLVLRYNCGTLDTFFTITQTKNLQHIASGLFVAGDMTGLGTTNQGIDTAEYQLSQVQSVRLGVQSQPVRLGVQSQPVRLGVQSQPVRLGVQSQPVRPGGQSQPLSTDKQSPLSFLHDDIGGDGKLASSNHGDHSALDGLDGRKLANNDDDSRLVGTGGDSHYKLARPAGGEVIRNRYSKKPARTGDSGKIRPSSIFGDVGGDSRPSSIGDDGDVINRKPASLGVGSRPNSIGDDGDVINRKPASLGVGSRPSSIGDDGDVVNRKPASVGVGGGRPSIFKSQQDDGELGDMNDYGKLVTTGNIGNKKKIFGGEDIAMDTLHGTSRLSNLHKVFPNQKMSSGRYQGLRSHPQSIVAHALSNDNDKRSGITLKSMQTLEHVKLSLKPSSNLKFQLTSDLKKTANDTGPQTGNTFPVNVRDLIGILPYHASNDTKLSGRHNDEQFKRQNVLHGKMELDRRALVPDRKSYLQESETGLCIGFHNMQVELMPCESIPSSVQFYGKPKSKPPAVPATQNPPASAVSPCGSTCPSTCAPSCAQSCCSTGTSYTQPNSGSCGSGCSSSCYPSCTSSCCDTGYQGSQGTSSSSPSSCPGSCSSAQACPSSQCPQSCCSGQGGSSMSQNQGGYSMSQNQGGYSMPQNQGGYSMSHNQGSSTTQKQQCPSGCKKHCRPSCPFSCC